MAISDIYTVDSGMVTISTTTQSPVLEYRAGSTKRGFLVGVRMEVGVTSAVAGNDIVFTIARAANTPAGGTTTGIGLRAHDAGSAAAINSVFIPTWTTAPTVGNILGEWTIPQTTGSSWEEFPPLGYEWVAGASSSLVGFVTLSVATATPVEFQFVISE